MGTGRACHGRWRYVSAVPQRRRRTTLRDVAEASGLSTATVSYALRGLQVPAATQTRVRAVARDLGYQVNPIARALASGRTGNVGVLFGSLEDLWQQGLAVALSRALLAQDRHALIVDANGDRDRERDLVHQLSDSQVDAVLVSPLDPAADYWGELIVSTPLVTIGDALPSAPGAGCVLFDNRRGVATALGHLAVLGHRRITVLTQSLPSTPDRPADTLAAELGADLGLDIVLVHSAPSIALAADAAERALSGPDRPTAVFALSDSLAYGAYVAARRLGLTIPDELSVLGYDDHQTSELVAPPLSTFSWDMPGIVAAATAGIAAAVDGGPAQRSVFSPWLRSRASTTSARRSA
jgi:DNA-binding LacI/PurR family transcriptional regulator